MTEPSLSFLHNKHFSSVKCTYRKAVYTQFFFSSAITIIIVNRLQREAAAFLHQQIRCTRFKNSFIHTKACWSICSFFIFCPYNLLILHVGFPPRFSGYFMVLFFFSLSLNYCCIRKGLRCSNNETVKGDKRMHPWDGCSRTRKQKRTNKEIFQVELSFLSCLRNFSDIVWFCNKNVSSPVAVLKML